MASLIQSLVVRPAQKICNYVFGRFSHEIDEGVLAAQTAVRIVKERVEHVKDYGRDSVSVEVVTAYDKVITSCKGMLAKEVVECQKLKTVLLKTTHNPHRAAAGTIRRLPIHRLEGQGLDRKMSFKPPRNPDSKRSVDYMENLRTLHPASDSYEERKKHRDAQMESIFGPERVNLAVSYASGHSGISNDSVLAEYNHNKRVEQTLGHHRDYQAMLRRQEEEQQRKKAEQETERAQKIAVFQYYWTIYQERVRKMVNARDQFRREIGQVLRAFENGNVQALHEAAHILNTNTLDPIIALFEEMQREIVLESMGAQELRNAWPTSSIEQVLTTITCDILSSLPAETQNAVGYMLQSLRKVCQPIFDAVELMNPLNEPAPHVFEARPIPPPAFEHYLSAKAKEASQQVKVEEAPRGENAGKNFSSFAALAAEGAAKKTSQEKKVEDVPEEENGKKNYSSFSALAAENKANQAEKKSRRFGTGEKGLPY